MSTCPDCDGRRRVPCPGCPELVDCPSCEGTGEAQPLPPEDAPPESGTRPTVDGRGEAWPAEAPTSPDAMRKHDEPL